MNINELIISTCDNPKGAIQIIHGAMEHIKRYEGLIEYFNSQGYIVVTDDLASHGKYLENEIHHVNNKEEVLAQVIAINKYIFENYDLPITILGHSMGSIIARNMILSEDVHFDNIILTGTLNPPTIKVRGGLMLQKLFMLKKGSHKKVNKLSNHLAFGVFEDMSLKKTGSKNWVCSDIAEYNKYVDDPLCQNPFSNGYILALIEMTLTAIQKDSLEKLDKANFLIISGQSDPVCNFGKEINTLKDKLSSDEDIILFKGLKHKVLKEKNKEEIYDMIIKKIEIN